MKWSKKSEQRVTDAKCHIEVNDGKINAKETELH